MDDDEDDDGYDDEEDGDVCWPSKAFHNERAFGHSFDAGEHRLQGDRHSQHPVPNDLKSRIPWPTVSGSGCASTLRQEGSQLSAFNISAAGLTVGCQVVSLQRSEVSTTPPGSIGASPLTSS